MGLTKMGPNTLTLTASDAYTGPTTISGGTLQLGNALALQQSTLNTSGTGSLSFGTLTSGTLGGLTGSGLLTLSNTASSAVALSVGNNNASTTYAGTMSGLGSLTKIGTGTLTLIGSNTYAGPTTISGGTLQLGDGTSGHNGSVSTGIADNSALVYDISGSQTYSGIISGNGTLTEAGSGTLTLNGSSSYTGRRRSAVGRWPSAAVARSTARRAS